MEALHSTGGALHQAWYVSDVLKLHAILILVKAYLKQGHRMQ